MKELFKESVRYEVRRWFYDRLYRWLDRKLFGRKTKR